MFGAVLSHLVNVLQQHEAAYRSRYQAWGRGNTAQSWQPVLNDFGAPVDHYVNAGGNRPPATPSAPLVAQRNFGHNPIAMKDFLSSQQPHIGQELNMPMFPGMMGWNPQGLALQAPRFFPGVPMQPHPHPMMPPLVPQPPHHWMPIDPRFRGII